MRRFRPLVRLLAVFLVTGLAACASSAATEGDTAGAATPAGQNTISIQNNHSSFTEVTVFMVAEATAARTPLGPVPPGETRTFNFAGPRGWYRLVAQRAAGGGDINSERFNMPDNSRIEWMTNQSRVVVRTR